MLYLLLLLLLIFLMHLKTIKLIVIVKHLLLCIKKAPLVRVLTGKKISMSIIMFKTKSVQ